MSVPMQIQDDDIIIESSSSGPATPAGISNPGTPRSVDTEMRNTPPPGPRTGTPQPGPAGSVSIPTAGATTVPTLKALQPQSKYAQLLAVIEDMGKDIRPTYSGSKTSAERLKRGIVHARILVRECLMECERAART